MLDTNLSSISTVDENKVDYTNLNTSEFNVDDENNISINTDNISMSWFTSNCDQIAELIRALT
mgnify:CR=1 FL=1